MNFDEPDYNPNVTRYYENRTQKDIEMLNGIPEKPKPKKIRKSSPKRK